MVKVAEAKDMGKKRSVTAQQTTITLNHILFLLDKPYRHIATLHTIAYMHRPDYRLDESVKRRLEYNQAAPDNNSISVYAIHDMRVSGMAFPDSGS